MGAITRKLLPAVQKAITGLKRLPAIWSAMLKTAPGLSYASVLEKDSSFVVKSLQKK
jgi:hypothetical protein